MRPRKFVGGGEIDGVVHTNLMLVGGVLMG